MLAISSQPNIHWQKLPSDFPLPDDPVDNIAQPLLAAALTESLSLAGRIPEAAITFTNYAICATLNDRFVVKAPDWGFVSEITVPLTEVNRSYTPRLEGQVPLIVMEFLSDSEGEEYSSKPTYPPGKWFFYEQILQVPNYAIFNPVTGSLEVYRLDPQGHYVLQTESNSGRYPIAEMNLELGVWSGFWQNRSGFWLRWWDLEGNPLLWGNERVEQERLRAEQERLRADQAEQQVERLLAKLRAAGLDP